MSSLVMQSSHLESFQMIPNVSKIFFAAPSIHHNVQLFIVDLLVQESD
jgi:hypothetical protein